MFQRPVLDLTEIIPHGFHSILQVKIMQRIQNRILNMKEGGHKDNMVKWSSQKISSGDHF